MTFYDPRPLQLESLDKVDAQLATRVVDPNVLERLLEQLEERILPPNRGRGYEDMIKLARHLYGYDGDEIQKLSPEATRDRSAKNGTALTQLYLLCYRAGMIGDTTQESHTYFMARFVRLMNFNGMMHMKFNLEHDLMQLFNGKKKLKLDSMNLTFCTPMTAQQPDDFPRLLLYMLRALAVSGMRRHGEDCYEQILTEEGHATNAWKQRCSIKEFIARTVSKETCFAEWQILNAVNNHQKTVQRLIDGEESEFPQLIMSRHLRSFRNGVLDTEKWKFYTYTSGQIPTEQACCKYFDMPFDERLVECDQDDNPMVRWNQIDTPYFARILKDQGWDEKDKKHFDSAMWVYCMFGKMLHETGINDNWQVLPVLIGKGATGKSVMLHVMEAMFPKAEIGIIQASQETTFGMQSWHNKMLAVCREMGRRFAMDKTDLLKIACNEGMVVPIKNHAAKIYNEFRVPLAFAGNVFPDWEDQGGALSRRLFCLWFRNMVAEKDTGLLDRILTNEMAMLIAKFELAYRECCARFSTKSIWAKDVTPDIFREYQDDMRCQVNPVMHFVKKSSLLEFDPEFEMGCAEFRQMFGAHCRDHKIVKAASNQDALIEDTLPELGLTTVRDKDRQEKNPYGDSEFIRGLRAKPTMVALMQPTHPTHQVRAY